tara:strand:- start:2091 stop:3023 length:933 start_codon:yes stop_codon:yes gene_type:complete
VPSIHEIAYSETVYVVGVSWRDNLSYLNVVLGDQTERLYVPATGLPMSFKVNQQKPRRCLGYTQRSHRDITYVACKNAPESGRLCGSCNKSDRIQSANLHQAHRREMALMEPAIKKYLEHPHRLYLAIFRDGSTKVGTTRGANGGQRLVEQGAWFARYVALASDGFEIRELEDLLTDVIGLKQAVNSTRKVMGHMQPLEDEILQIKLSEIQSASNDALDLRWSDTVTPLNVSWSNPASGLMAWTRTAKYPLPLDAGTHNFEIDSMIGRLAGINRLGFPQTLIADLYPLFGQPLQFGDYEADGISIQEALF